MMRCREIFGFNWCLFLLGQACLNRQYNEMGKRIVEFETKY